MMTKATLHSEGQLVDSRRPGVWAVWLFCLVVVALSVSLLLLLPGVGGPLLVVFIPTVTAVALIGLTAGKGQVRARLFNRGVWRLSWKWLLISLGVALGLRLGVSLLGLLVVADYAWRPGAFSPLLLFTLLSAAAEQIGWRGFALPTLLAHGYRPLTAALVLGVPWGLLHLPLVLPGMLSAGVPPVAQFLIMVSLSVLVTWAYLGGGRSLSAAVLLHAGQNMFVVLNSGLSAVDSGWLMAVVYGGVALIVILVTRGRLGQAAENAVMPTEGLGEAAVSG